MVRDGGDADVTQGAGQAEAVVHRSRPKGKDEPEMTSAEGPVRALQP